MSLGVCKCNPRLRSSLGPAWYEQDKTFPEEELQSEFKGKVQHKTEQTRVESGRAKQ